MSKPTTTAFDLILLDRDGVINADSADYIKSADEWHALPSAGSAIATLTQAGQKVAVCTNQSGLARNLFDAPTLASIHAKLTAYLTEHQTQVDHIYWCPHGPADNCSCRKPAPGMLLQAMADFNIAPERTAFVGDSLRDLQAAATAGCQPVLVLTGNGGKTQGLLSQQQHQALAAQTWVTADLLTAAQQLTGNRVIES